jgi:hypothetical protein
VRVRTSSNQKWTSPAVDQVKVNWDAVKIMLYTGCSNQKWTSPAVDIDYEEIERFFAASRKRRTDS